MYVTNNSKQYLICLYSINNLQNIQQSYKLSIINYIKISLV